MFWVFCNVCFTKPTHGNHRIFYITNCSHIIYICKRCDSPCKYVPCNAQMPEDLKEIFSDAYEKTSELLKALEYQAGQRSGLFAYQRTVIQKYQAAKVHIKQQDTKLAAYRKHYETSKYKIQELEGVIASLNRKLDKYKKEYGSGSSLNTLRNFNQINVPRPSKQSPSSSISSVLNNRSESGYQTPMPFTPRNCYDDFRCKTPMSTFSDSQNKSFTGSWTSFTPTPTPKDAYQNYRSKTPQSTSTPTTHNRSFMASEKSSVYSGHASGGQSGFSPSLRTLELLALINKPRQRH